MSKLPKLQRLALWQPIRIEQTSAANSFVIEVDADDQDVGLFVAEGRFDVPRPPMNRSTRQALRLTGGMLGLGLSAHLSLSLLDLGAFKRDVDSEALPVYCHRVVVTPGAARLSLLCSLEPLPEGELPVPADVHGAVLNAHAEHLARLAAHRMARVRAERDARSALRQWPELQGIKNQLQAGPPPPTFNLFPLASAFPPGLMVRLAGTDPDAVERACRRAIVTNPDEGNPPPRAGWYEASVAACNPRAFRAFVTWTPHRGLPPYPEVRAAALRRLPRAFASPRLTSVTPPQSEAGVTVDSDNFPPLLDFDPSNLDALDGDDFSLGFDDPGKVAEGAKDGLRALGFDYIGWYQAHHTFSEEAWGIYIDAPKLDETAFSIAEDLRAGGLRRGRDALAAKLALMLVYRHELFHAKVEAALTWLELQALQPKFRRYKAQVYAALKGTDGHLEEALANFSAWTWISADTVVQQLTGQLRNEDRRVVEQVVRNHLDLSPPGYRRWPDGQLTETWRTLATQIAQGRPVLPGPGFGLPIETMLREALPFDYDERRDVPCRFVGEGRIASSLFGAPATLNLPSRR